MNLIRKNAAVICVVNNEQIYFIEPDPEKRFRVLKSMPLQQFLNEETDKDAIPFTMRNRENKLLIVPDYWVANTSYPFQSSKESLIESFIKRKLAAGAPQSPGCSQFFEYTSYLSDENVKTLHVIYYQEPAFFQLFDKLSDMGLSPQRITAPVFLCEHEVRKKAPDFNKGGCGIIHLCNSKCFLYFFSKGVFLFERNILIPDAGSTILDKSNILTYEINQSLYLYAQKTKAQLSRFYLLSSSIEKMGEISESTGIEVVDLSELMVASDRIDDDLIHEIGPLPSFRATDIHASSQLISISHRQRKKELEWRPVQRVGLAAGVILLLLIGLESGYLRYQISSMENKIKHIQMASDVRPDERIRQYNEALDLFIAEANRRSPSHILAGIIDALPDGFRPKEMKIETKQNPSVNFSGRAQVKDIDGFKQSLSSFVSNINTRLPVQRPVTIQDIQFTPDMARPDSPYMDYTIQVKANLN